MIPLSDGIPARRFPVVNVALIAAKLPRVDPLRAAQPGLGGPPRVVLPVRGERRLPRPRALGDQLVHGHVRGWPISLRPVVSRCHRSAGSRRPLCPPEREHDGEQGHPRTRARTWPARPRGTGGREKDAGRSLHMIPPAPIQDPSARSLPGASQRTRIGTPFVARRAAGTPGTPRFASSRRSRPRRRRARA
jgi:hypothetical protein